MDPRGRPYRGPRWGTWVVVVLLVVTGVERAATQEVVFQRDFEPATGPGETTSPSGRGFAGRFGNNVAGFTLDDLPPHAGVRIQFSLYLIGSWDGNHEYYGQDIWSMGVVGGRTLVRTPFANGFDRAFPDDPHERNTLGYPTSNGGDSVYFFDVETAHSESSIRIEFAASGLQSLSDESWGVDDIVVTVGDAPSVDTRVPGLPLDPQATAAYQGAVISWDASSYIGVGIDRYRILRSPAPSNLGRLGFVVVAGDTTVATVDGLSTGGTQYTFRVMAIDTLGNISISEATDPVIPLAEPPGPATPSMEFVATHVDDNTVGDSDGDGDGRAEPGETIELSVFLANGGAADATGVVGNLTSADPDVIVTSATSTYGSVPAGTASSGLFYVVAISPDAAPHGASFSLTVTAENGGPWELTFVEEIYEQDAGPPDGNDEPWNATHVLPDGAWHDESFGSGSDVDWFRFEAVAGSAYTVETGGLGGGADTVIALYGDPPSIRISRNDDYPGYARASRIDWIATASATVLIEVRQFGSSGTGTYSVRAFPTELPGEGNDVSTGATPLTADGAWLDESFSSAGDVDWFEFEGVAGSTYAVETGRLLDGADTAITLFGPSSISPIGENDDYPGASRASRIDWVAAASGTYLAHVRHWSGSGTGSYSVRVETLSVGPSFAMRNAWIFDGGGDANGDGMADAGERVRPRVRLKNEGAGAASNVRVVLWIDDADVVVVNGEALHSSWPAGEARNNEGFVLDITPDATAHAVTAVVDVTADSGGPWRFTYTFQIVPPPPGLAARSFWMRDRTTGNDDGDANPGERVEIKARLKHEGETDLLNVVATLRSSDDVTIVRGQVTHATWPAGVARNNDGLLVELGVGVTASVAFTLDVAADNGGPWQFSFTLPVVPLPVVLTQRNFWIRDKVTGNADGDANPGERLEVRARIRNDSLVDAENVLVELTSTDPSVTVVSGQVAHATWPAGIARNNEGLVIEVGSDAVDAVSFALDITADNGGPWQFTYTLPVIPLPVGLASRSFWIRDKVTGNADAEANPGERLEVKARIKNESETDYVNVVATLSSRDDVAIVRGEVTHATWPAGVARNNDGLLVELGAGATGQVAFALHVTADNGGPWEFAYTLPVTPLPVVFIRRNFWIRDKVTGNGDGEADAGERVEIKARLKNDSATDAENVRVTLSSGDDVVVVSGEVTHATWPAGSAQNNDGLVLDIGDGASGSVAFTLDVTADNGGPWQFTYTLPVVAAPVVGLAARSFWARDKTTGNNDGDANPGERLQIKARLKNESDTEFTNVVSTLSTDDPNITIVNGEKTYGTWAAGVAKNNDGLLIELGPDVSGSAAFTLDVTADNGGPWQFTYTLPIVTRPPEFIFRSAWTRDKTTGDGDGIFEPGERLEVRVRMKNEGQMAAENVVVTLRKASDFVNATVVTGVVTHATWPAGEVRNNVGLVVDFGHSAVTGFPFDEDIALILDVTADNAGPWQFAFSVVMQIRGAPVALAAPADIDLDGAVDIKDILTVATVYGQAAPALPMADLNDDRVLDLSDMVLIESARADGFVGAPSARRSPVGLVERWLREAAGADDGSSVFRDGIPALGALLASLRPTVSALLPNYPNPFNPETWIPFDLAEPSDVTARVYDMQGHEVRRLDLGHLDAGRYHGRSTAAHWDGRNDIGESVASGVYVYEVRAGSFAERRRMVIHK